MLELLRKKEIEAYRTYMELFEIWTEEQTEKNYDAMCEAQQKWYRINKEIEIEIEIEKETAVQDSA